MTRSLLLRLHSYEQTEPPSLHIIETLPNHSSNLFPLSDLINNEERQYKMMSTSRICTFLLLALAAISTSAFVTGKPSAVSKSIPSVTQPTTTSLAERQWNFNEGRAPWGLKKNAEIWNGRVAQMAFVWVVLQELITGKGIFKGLEEGDFFFIANAGLFGVTVVGLTAWLAIKGDNDYTKN